MPLSIINDIVWQYMFRPTLLAIAERKEDVAHLKMDRAVDLGIVIRPQEEDQTVGGRGPQLDAYYKSEHKKTKKITRN